MVYAMIMAGGTGSRMGSDLPKQYIKINNKSILSYTAAVFANHTGIDKILILTPQDWIDYTREILREELADSSKVTVIAGGAERSDTLMNGIRYIEEHEDDPDAVKILSHDAVRPFLTQEIISSNIEALDRYTACDTVFPATDTIVHSRDGVLIDAVPDRSELYHSQTPQSFRLKDYKDTFLSLTEEEKAQMTDAAKVFVARGKDVALVEGSSFNIKVTYPSDLKLAESILTSRDV